MELHNVATRAVALLKEKGLTVATTESCTGGMIAAAIANSVSEGIFSTTLSLAVAIFINFLLMVCASGINRFLTRTHMLGPLIRLTGLVISAVAMQMIITGIKVCFNIR